MASHGEALSRLQVVRQILLPVFAEEARGKLTVAELGKEIPFPIVRAFWIYAVPEEAERAAHAHRRTHQMVFAMSGRFELELSDARNTRTYTMDDPCCGIHVPPLIWTRLYAFSRDAICLVLASEPYDSSDYIRDWDEFAAGVGN